MCFQSTSFFVEIDLKSLDYPKKIKLKTYFQRNNFSKVEIFLLQTIDFQIKIRD